ncbi:MAG: hypothetical protein WD069_11055, partial [Planctomycetales bacterium]
KGAPAEAIPEGFEIRESPTDGLVTLRKQRAHATTPEERRLIEDTIRDQTMIEHFIVDPDGDSLVVYVNHLEGPTGEGDDLAARFEWMNVEDLVERAQLEALMRFELRDAHKRLFQAYRWCFRGRIDDWIPLFHPAGLASVLEKTVPHLESESFFDLY